MPSSGVQTCALRSEEHTSELQSHDNLVCRLLLEKQKPTPPTPRRAPPPAPPPPPAPLVRPRRPPSLRRGPLWGGAGRGGRSAGCVCFFFKDPAPPEIYPLPPPGPLPI